MIIVPSANTGRQACDGAQEEQRIKLLDNSMS
jgi:hypothetical protein